MDPPPSTQGSFSIHTSFTHGNEKWSLCQELFQTRKILGVGNCKFEFFFFIGMYPPEPDLHKCFNDQSVFAGVSRYRILFCVFLHAPCVSVTRRGVKLPTEYALTQNIPSRAKTQQKRFSFDLQKPDVYSRKVAQRTQKFEWWKHTREKHSVGLSKTDFGELQKCF